jgi:MYXO-CTERM domain-containing protein
VDDTGPTDDTATGDSASPDDSGDDIRADDPKDGGCGCATAPDAGTGGLFAAMLGALLIRRRRER